jgi:hypothetical protein
VGCPDPHAAALPADDAALAVASSASGAAAPSASSASHAAGPFLPDRPYDLAADLRSRTDDLHRRFGNGAPFRIESDVFLFAGTDPGARLDAAVALAHQALPRYFADRFAKPPDRAVTVLLFGSHAAFGVECAKLLDVPRCQKPLGLYWPTTRTILVDVSPGVSTVTHEIVHPIMQTDFPAAPEWLDEGIAALFERPVFDGADGIHGATNWRLTALQRALGRSPTESAAQIAALFGMTDDAFRGASEGASPNADDAVREDRHYAIARFLCQWLDEKGELWKFYRAWRDGSAEESRGVAAFTAAVGESPADAQVEWWQWAKGLRQ